MRVGHLNVTRPMPWDRSPNVNSILFDAGVAGVQIVWLTQVSYTVPASTKAYIDSMSAALLVTTAGVNDYVGMRWVLNIGGSDIPLLTVYVNCATVQQNGGVVLGSVGIVLAGHVISLQTYRHVAAAVVNGVAGTKLTEFGA